MSVKMEGMEDITRKLNSLGKPRLFLRPMTKSVNYLHEEMNKSPTKSGTWAAWADRHPAARKAYWAKVASGEAKHGPGGYVRSGRLSRDWTKKISMNGRRGEVINENTGGYAHYAQGPNQVSFHKDTGYPRTDKVAQKGAPKVIGFFKRAYDKELAR